MRPSPADAVITGTAVPYFAGALVISTAFVLRLALRTSPRWKAGGLSRFEATLAPWLWTRQTDLTTVATELVAAAGAATCAVTYFLPLVTFTNPPLFPGDPLAGPVEHAPAAKALGAALGLVVALLALRRAVGGEGVTVLAALLLSTVLAVVATLALQDYLSNDHSPSGRFTPVVTAGTGLVVLIVGAAFAWLGCAADLAVGLRGAFRNSQRGDVPMAP